MAALVPVFLRRPEVGRHTTFSAGTLISAPNRGCDLLAAIRISLGELYADILVDRRGPRDVWMYVIQREGSPDILAMGSCDSEKEARKTASDALQRFVWRNSQAAG